MMLCCSEATKLTSLNDGVETDSGVCLGHGWVLDREPKP